MTKPKFFTMALLRKVIPPHYNINFSGTENSQSYEFSSPLREYKYSLFIDKEMDYTTISREDPKVDEESGEEYNSFNTVFTTNYNSRRNALHYLKKILK